jgi:SNF2 family DNA or RNA helicase
MNLQFTESNLIKKLFKQKPATKELGRLAFETIKASLISDIEQLFIASYSGKNYIRYPHQVYAASRVLQVMQGRGILADEVGMGKTIEAGLILKELRDYRKLVQKVLIIVPASLCSQWQYQMFDIFDFKFVNASWQKSEHKDEVWDFLNEKYKDNAFTNYDLVITSYEKAIREEEKIKQTKWDMIICDEAHKLRNRKYVYQLIKELNPRYILLLTATPIHNKLEDFYNLADLVRPGFFGTFSNFKNKFYTDSSGRKLKNREEFEIMKNQVMVRQRASEINLPIPERIVKSLTANASKKEIEFHQAVERYIAERARIIKEYALSEQQRWAEQFELMHLGMRANSSPLAIKITLERKLEKSKGLGVEVEKKLKELLQLTREIKHPSKTEELKNILEYHLPQDKVLIYTIYEDTQRYLSEVLNEMGIKFLPFGGYMKSKERANNIRMFNEDPNVQVLLSTDAGSEGLNLQQACHTLINFDLPWNPMRMEQRIGRLHRIGQTHKVLVYNLAVKGSIDDKIVMRLYEKIGLTKRAIGEIEPILTDLEERIDIEKEILQIVSEARVPEDLEVKNRLLEERISQEAEKIKEEQVFNKEILERFTNLK